jgi:hypothetical protein
MGENNFWKVFSPGETLNLGTNHQNVPEFVGLVKTQNRKTSES